MYKILIININIVGILMENVTISHTGEKSLIEH